MRNLILFIFMFVGFLGYSQTFDFSCAPEVAPDTPDTASWGDWVNDGEEYGGSVTSSETVYEDWILEETAPNTQEFLNEIRTVTFVTNISPVYQDQIRVCNVTVNGNPDDVAPTCSGNSTQTIEVTAARSVRAIQPDETRVSTTENPNYQPDTEWGPAYDINTAGTYNQTQWENGVQFERVVTVTIQRLANQSSTEENEQIDVNSDGDMLDDLSRRRHLHRATTLINGVERDVEPFIIRNEDWTISQNNSPVVVPEDTASQILEDAILGSGNLSFTVSGTTYVFNRRSIAGGSAFDLTYGPDEIGIMTISIVHTNNTVVRIDVTHYDENELVVVSDIGTFDYAHVSAGDTTFLDGFIAHMEGVLTRYQQ